MSPITVVQTVHPTGRKPRHRLVCLNLSVDIGALAQSCGLPLVWLTTAILHTCKTIFALFMAPLLATRDINDTCQQNFFRIPQTAIKAYSSCTTACQGGPTGPPPDLLQAEAVLCSTIWPYTRHLFVHCLFFNNVPIQQQHYKSECCNKKKKGHNSHTFSGPSCSIYIVFMCFSLLPPASPRPCTPLCH